MTGYRSTYTKPHYNHSPYKRPQATPPIFKSAGVK